jgi:glycyl-tRNA synthetase beta subunit
VNTVKPTYEQALQNALNNIKIAMHQAVDLEAYSEDLDSLVYLRNGVGRLLQNLSVTVDDE